MDKHPSKSQDNISSGMTIALTLMLALASSITAAFVSPYLSDAAASDIQPESAGDRALRIGIVGTVDGISTLNPLQYTTTKEKMVIWPCYSTLLTYDADANEIGDLARSWSISQDGTVLTFQLYQTAVWYDKNSPGPYQAVTAHDVMFTYFTVQNNTRSFLNSYLPTMDGQPILKRMVVGPTDWDLTIELSSPYSPILGALHSIPILPKYIWQSHSWDWANYATGIAPCIGSGPFYYGQNGLPTTTSIELVRSPTWFGTEERGWQLHVNELVIKSQITDDSNLAAFQEGSIDVMMWANPDQYEGALAQMEALGDATRLRTSTGSVYEYNLNQMTDALRKDLGGSFEYGENNQLLLDPIVKTALAMSYDKQVFIDQVYHGLGQTADSLVPRVHPYYYDYGGPGAPADEVEITQDVAGARALLYNNGWQYRTDGSPILTTDADYSTYYPLCKIGGTSPLRFRFYTLDVSPEWNTGGMLLADWAGQIGVDLWSYYSLKSLGEMNAIWMSADYDIWLWDWAFAPTDDVSADILRVFTTDDIGGWSDVFYSNSTYDSLYDQSLTTVDSAMRKIITDEMQRMVYEDHGCQPVAYEDDLFAVRASAPDYWGNWGDWSAQWLLEPSQCYPWLYTTIEPADNLAPDVQIPYDLYEGMVDLTITFTASGSDDTSSLEYRWIFGDGSKSDWSPSLAAAHTYTTDGWFTATIVARETDTLDGFMSYDDTTVWILDPDNTAPHDLDFTWVPSNPNTGELVTFTGAATDDDDDPLTYSWDFGDGFAASGQSVSHQFIDGTSNVTMYVDDGRFGVVPRPVALTRLVTVTENSPPSIEVPDFPIVDYNQDWPFTVNCTNLDPRDQLRVTWYWGDGTVSVSNLQSDGGTFQLTELHTYQQRRVYTLTVWIDDLTNLPGHNISDQGMVIVTDLPPNKPPVIVYFNADNNPTDPGQLVTFTLLATDQDHDTLSLTVEFGDGATASIVMGEGTEWVVQHAYMASGSYDVWATVTDGIAAPVESLITMEVTTPFVEVNLAAGWNLFSLPLLSTDYNAANLGLPFGSVVVSGWNESTQSYDPGFIVGISPPQTAFAITEGKGYWIFASAACTIVIHGDILMTTHYYEWTVPVGGGWVMVGFPKTNSTWHASDIPGWCDPPNSVTIVCRYNAPFGIYQAYIPQFPATDFALVLGEGLWIFLTQSVICAYGP